MNDDSAVDRTGNSARAIVLWILRIVLILLFFGGLLYLYQNSGYKEYQASLAYLNSLSGSHND